MQKANVSFYMDMPKPKQQTYWKHSYTVTAIILLVIVVGGLALLPSKQPKIFRDQLLLGSVQRGDMQVSVDGYGVLRSDKQTLITALTSATVEEVLLRPGVAVEADSIILRLANHELLQEVDSAKALLLQEEANLRRLSLDNQRELLAEQATLAELQANSRVAKLRTEAEKQLAGGAVSILAYKTSVLQQEQMEIRVNLQIERINQLKNVQRESLIIQQEQVAQTKAQYQTIQQKLDRLVVRAGQKGVLQRLPVELGQSVQAGQELALVGSDKDLRALVKVSQAKAEKLQVGQLAEINTRRERAPGVVTRITPEVRDGTIEVEIAFSEGVPASARPELNVDARIIISKLVNTLFIERPVNIQNHMTSNLFKINADGDMASLTKINFGEDSERFIQIKSGAVEKEQYILSDVSNFHGIQNIRIID